MSHLFVWFNFACATQIHSSFLEKNVTEHAWREHQKFHREWRGMKVLGLVTFLRFPKCHRMVADASDNFHVVKKKLRTIFMVV